MYVLGINFFHSDSAAALVHNGKILSAVEEEKFTRIKHFTGFPSQAIKFCIDNSNISLRDVECVAINTNFRYNLIPKIRFAAKNYLYVLNHYKKFLKKKSKEKINELLYENFGNTTNKKIFQVPHHIAHASSVALCSSEDSGMSFSFDASGDFSTIEIYKFHKNNFKLLKKNYFPHSLGIFYQAITQFLGFTNYGDEYKVMGLAAFGKPKYLDKFKEICKVDRGNFILNLDYFLHHKTNFDLNNKNNFTSYFSNLFSPKLESLLGKKRIKDSEILERHMDIAASLQKTFEIMTLNLINYYYNNFKIKPKNLFLSGGCALNSLANKYILENSKFEKIIIPSNPGDAGGSVGAALYASSKLDKDFLNTKVKNSYLGPQESKDVIQKNIEIYFYNNKDQFSIEYIANIDELLLRTATALKDNRIVAWHQGRLEFGPRALGNRSILANPYGKDIKYLLNKKIKNREIFRPFAPTILDVYAENYLTIIKNHEYKLMNLICDVNSNKLNEILNTINNDKTARPQILNQFDNYKYYQLLQKFYDLTGVPVLLNTSLNIEEPICCDSIDSIKTFMASEIDMLVIDNFIISRLI